MISSGRVRQPPSNCCMVSISAVWPSTTACASICTSGFRGRVEHLLRHGDGTLVVGDHHLQPHAVEVRPGGSGERCPCRPDSSCRWRSGHPCPCRPCRRSRERRRPSLACPRDTPQSASQPPICSISGSCAALICSASFTTSAEDALVEWRGRPSARPAGGAGSSAARTRCRRSMRRTAAIATDVPVLVRRVARRAPPQRGEERGQGEAGCAEGEGSCTHGWFSFGVRVRVAVR